MEISSSFLFRQNMPRKSVCGRTRKKTIFPGVWKHRLKKLAIFFSQSLVHGVGKKNWKFLHIFILGTENRSNSFCGRSWEKTSFSALLQYSTKIFINSSQRPFWSQFTNAKKKGIKRKSLNWLQCWYKTKSLNYARTITFSLGRSKLNQILTI